MSKNVMTNSVSFKRQMYILLGCTPDRFKTLGQRTNYWFFVDLLICRFFESIKSTTQSFINLQRKPFVFFVFVFVAAP
jgi:hypothetical protein